MENAAIKLKTLIDSNGPGYLTEKPYRVYSELLESEALDRKTAGAVLCYLVSSMAEKNDSYADMTKISDAIQKECGLNEEMADRLAEIFHSLYSDENRSEWEKKAQEGLSAFLSENFKCTWKGFSVWNAGNGAVFCSYETEFELAPLKEAAYDAELDAMLKKNPFMTKEKIHEYFEYSIRAYLDDEFEWYCTCDDYYPPVVEDFGIVNLLSSWSREHGFKLMSCDGYVYDDGYEPK